jgi:hypothetical protein
MFLVSYMTSPMPLSCTSGNHDCHIATVLYIVKDSVNDLSLSSRGRCRVAISIVAGDILAARVRSIGGLGRALYSEHSNLCIRLVSS